MKGPVRRAVAANKYTLAVCWGKLNGEDKDFLLTYVKKYSNYGDAAHMGMLPLIAAKTIFMVLDRAEDKNLFVFHPSKQNWKRVNPDIPERIRSNLRLAINRDLKLNERLAKQRARERRM